MELQIAPTSAYLISEAKQSESECAQLRNLYTGVGE